MFAIHSWRLHNVCYSFLEIARWLLEAALETLRTQHAMARANGSD